VKPAKALRCCRFVFAPAAVDGLKKHFGRIGAGSRDDWAGNYFLGIIENESQ